MTTSPHHASRSFSRFTPKKLVSQGVGKKYISLYPKQMIGETWPDVEINLALNINKTTLKNADISKNLIIDTLADQFGATTQIQVQYQSFLSVAKSKIHDSSFLEVMSYQDKNAKIVSDAVILTTDLSKPVNSRPGGLYFAKLRCEFDFTEVKVVYTMLDYDIFFVIEFLILNIKNWLIQNCDLVYLLN